MKKIGYLLFFVVMVFYVTCSYAREKSIILTPAVIQSLEHCPPRQTVGLSCRSYTQTTTYTCGPAVMMLMNYYGMLSAKDMNRQTELRIASEMGTTSGGTSPPQMISWLEKHGFSVESGSHIVTNVLIENINHKIPTIVGFSQHWLLAKGYRKGATSDEDEIVFADSCCSVTSISRKVMESASGGFRMSRGDCASGYIVAIKK